MDFYMVNRAASSDSVLLDDMILETGVPTTAGSRMLQGFESLLEAEVVTRLKKAGLVIGGKAPVGEFSFDVVGESGSAQAPLHAAATLIREGKHAFAVTLDVNGAPRRGAAAEGILCLKPTYGTVSRYGTVPVACSGETVSVLARSAAALREAFGLVSGHDEKDGTSLSEAQCRKYETDDKTPCRVAVLVPKEISDESREALLRMEKTLSEKGIALQRLSEDFTDAARVAWNVLMSAELCNNVSRYDGVKYGYRSPSFNGLDELYTNSRTEAFGPLLKKAILFGSETLSTQNYFPVYDKALRVRRVLREKLESILTEFDAILLPTGSRLRYEREWLLSRPEACYRENRYTAPASLTGLPALVANGVQFLAAPLGEGLLFRLAEIVEKEEK